MRGAHSSLSSLFLVSSPLFSLSFQFRWHLSLPASQIPVFPPAKNFVSRPKDIGVQILAKRSFLRLGDAFGRLKDASGRLGQETKATPTPWPPGALGRLSVA